MCASSQRIKSQAWKALSYQDLQNNSLSKTKKEGEKNHRHMKKHLMGLKLMPHMVESK